MKQNGESPYAARGRRLRLRRLLSYVLVSHRLLA